MDGGKDIADACALSGEPIIEQLGNVVDLDGPPVTINDLWDLQLQKTAYQKKVLELWNETAMTTRSGNVMDAFIMPIAPFAAVSHNDYDHVSYSMCVCPEPEVPLTKINLLDYPSCVVPVTFADKDIDKRDTSYKPISDLDKLVWEKCTP